MTRSKIPHHVRVTKTKAAVTGRCQNPDCSFEVTHSGAITSAKERGVRENALWHESHTR